MSESLSSPRSGFLSRSWHDSAAWNRAADILAAMVAVFLPWSTSLVAIAIVLWMLALIPTLDVRRLYETFMRRECAIPAALFVLAVIGTLWATDVPWAARLHGINPVAKLLVIPLLIYHFETSSRSLWVLIGFLASCVALMMVSWGLYATGTLLTPVTLGVPVKDYIAQSQEFALCAFGAAGAAMLSLRERRVKAAYFLIGLAAAFIVSMVFVATSRTALVCIPVLLLVFALKYFRKRGLVVGLVAACLLAVLAVSVSTALRDRISSVFREYDTYKTQHTSTSTGQRIEFWRKSMTFIEDAPLLGHGTGSLRTLFEQAAVGQTGVSSDVVNNPHNQTLNVMIQWGVVGAILLYAMWIAHLMLFRGGGLAAWIGLIAVVENIVSSLFNSHIFDFLQGWIYVVAVGVAAGMVRRQELSRTVAQPDITRSDVS